MFRRIYDFITRSNKPISGEVRVSFTISNSLFKRTKRYQKIANCDSKELLDLGYTLAFYMIDESAKGNEFNLRTKNGENIKIKVDILERVRLQNLNKKPNLTLVE